MRRITINKHDAAGEPALSGLLLAGRSGKRGKGALACARPWRLSKPCRHSHEIQRCGQEQVHQSRFRLPDISRAAQIACMHTLRDGTLDPSTPRILGFELHALLPLACRLQRLVVIAFADTQYPWPSRRPRAIRATRASGAARLAERDLYRGMPV